MILHIELVILQCFIRISEIALPLIDTALLHVYVFLFILQESVG